MTVSNGSTFLSPYNVDIYSIQKRSNAAAFFFTTGKKWERETQWIPAYSLGVYYQHSFLNTLSGVIMQYSDPSFENYTYTWDTSANMVLASTKITIYQFKKVAPYVTGGVGISFNHMNAYQETAFSDVIARMSPAFVNHTNSQLAYQVGAGVDIPISFPWSISIGYLYQNRGDVTSGQGLASWRSTSLCLRNFAQNEVVASINYIFR